MKSKLPKTSITPMLNIRPTSRDNRHTLIIQLIRERRRGVIFTPYRLLPEEFDRQKGRAVATSRRKDHLSFIHEINEFLDRQREELGRIIRELERERHSFCVRDITTAYRQRYDNRYVRTFFLHQIEELHREGSQGTANNYRSTLLAFEKFAGTRRIHFDQVDTNLLLDFEQHLRQIPLQPNTVVFYLSNFRAVYNKAQKRGYVTRDTSPFRAVSLHVEKTRKLAVSAEVIRRVSEAEFSDVPLWEQARDLFMFSFYTRGMSFVDMAYLRQENIRDGVIRYRRRKTGQLYSVKVLPQVGAILDRYRTLCSPWALPVMLCPGEAPGQSPAPLVPESGTPDDKRAFEAKAYRRYKYSLSRYLRSFRELSRGLQLSTDLSFNVARHTWASLARNQGIPVSVISVGLGHTSEKTTQIYLDELDNSRVDAANEMVAGLLENVCTKPKKMRALRSVSAKKCNFVQPNGVASITNNMDIF